MRVTGRRIRIRGRVQGVFFRNWAIAEANALGLAGWVRNRTDGSVELLAFGAEDAVDAMIEKCRQGPLAARIESVEVEPAEGEAPSSFTRAATA